jgi:membrane protein implicated in regulation of membrane protease activity
MAEPFDVGLPMILFVIGAGLTVAEAFIPGAHFIVIGVALLVAGLRGLVVGGPLAGPLGLAATTLLVGAAALYLYRQLGIFDGEGIAKTRDSDSLKGETGIVTERVTTTSGEVKLDGGGFNPHYQARTVRGSIEEGEQVMVVDPGGGNVVTVESLGAVEDDIDRALARERDRSREREDA